MSPNYEPREDPTLAPRLAELAAIGLVPAPGVVESDLVFSGWSGEPLRNTLEELIERMGGELERSHYTPICPALWMCDTECIAGDGSYAEVLARLEAMTGGALGLRDITDRVDEESGVAWVEFEHLGQRVRWDLEVRDDWLDPAILEEYDQLLEWTDCEARIYYSEKDYGQALFLAAFTRERKRAFDRLVTSRFRPIRRG